MPAFPSAHQQRREEQEHTPRDAPAVQISTAEDHELLAQQDDEMDAVADRDRIRVLPGSTETAASFQFDNEDHTLGNALRYIIMKNPQVEFCGYSIPHPSEAHLNLRIQTYDNVSVYSVLEKGLRDLEDMCDVVIDKFSAARAEFRAKQGAAGGADTEMVDA
ncbi:RBP11-like subunits of RNA polymerase [Westerdykella ornata]|uniref:DNA-directed RNA polymerases I and III subunit RPAC2 n=1 Tax=Westerdykella ornata TaxID=318751 RepID=A0A6A6JG83_WESOR|nr:RBP11-like subunits of RNA polymerase [Westerdykella ornata]KAF2275275.1 RBP11-like subunits of RNA polymerase [Westerdykella ornata]